MDDEDGENILVGSTVKTSFKPPPLGSRKRRALPRARASAAASTGNAVVANLSMHEDDVAVDARFSETATFGMGCFWGAEAAFRSHLDARGGAGVTRVGYAGGDDERTPRIPSPPLKKRQRTTSDGADADAVADDAEGTTAIATRTKAKESKPLTLKDVKTGKFGHAEVVRVRYDPSAVTYDALLRVFYANHDPRAKKANDKYRSVIFAHSQSHVRAAEASVASAKQR